MGFWVAITRKAGGSGWVTPSMVTARSCMAWSSAAWVLGGVRLISSATSTSVKIGPRVSWKVLVRKSNRFVPSTSPGMRSGVNWTRLNPTPSAAAKARASSVLAVPGTPSTRTCPSERRAVRSRSRAASCPITTLWISTLSASTRSRIACSSIGELLPPARDLLSGADGLEVGAALAVLDARHALLQPAQHPGLAPGRLQASEPCGGGLRAARRRDPCQHLLARRAQVGARGLPGVAAGAEQLGGVLHQERLPGPEQRRG